MDDLLDLVLGILFEGALEAAGSRRVPLPVRVALWIVLLAFMAGIVGLVAWVGVETGRPGLLVLSAAMAAGFALMLWALRRQHREKK